MAIVGFETPGGRRARGRRPRRGHEPGHSVSLSASFAQEESKKNEHLVTTRYSDISTS